MPKAGDVAKRSLDLLLGAVAFTVTLPIQALTVLAIRTSMGRPVLFRQERAGLHGRPFTLVK
ncbi:MAG TPA: sugar transferase, partial [Propionibacteriaceae bacterium]